MRKLANVEDDGQILTYLDQVRGHECRDRQFDTPKAPARSTGSVIERQSIVQVTGGASLLRNTFIDVYMVTDRSRRRFLGAVSGVIATLSGCAGAVLDDGSDQERNSDGMDNNSPTDTSSPRTIIVDPEDGSHSGTGTTDDPYRSLKRAVDEAEPGDTVHAETGEHNGPVVVDDGGEPDDPITITGPADAVLTGERDEHRISPLVIRGSHIRLTGLSIDGLLDPDAPDNPRSYARYPLVDVTPAPDTEEYLEDLVVAPHGIGNAFAHMVVVTRSKNVEVGPFEVTNLAGANYIFPDDPDEPPGDATGSHVGEIVYLGTPPETYDLDAYPWDEIDRTRNVHVHHIDNSAGHPHSEMVDAKLGTENVLVEYCTDGGGSQIEEDWSTASVLLLNQDSTVRWCDLREGSDNGVKIDAGGRYWLEDRNADRFGEDDDAPVEADEIGTGHALYGNRIGGFDDRTVWVRHTPVDDVTVCGNELGGEIIGHHGESYTQPNCPADLPEGDGIGHTGGEDSIESR